MDNQTIVQALREAVSDWFYDVACRGHVYNTRDELIDNIYLWMNGKNILGTRKCYVDCLADTFSEDFIDKHYEDIVDELADCAEEVWYNLYEDDMLPEKYAHI